MNDLFKNWNFYLDQLYDLYAGRKHPLEYNNLYELVIMVILSAQDSDAHINTVSRPLFDKYTSMKELSAASSSDIIPYIRSVKNCARKAVWAESLAKTIESDDRIPKTMTGLTALPGIGRKSANVIIRESGGTAEGIIVDLHVMRVAPRMGIAMGKTPEKVEKELMEIIPHGMWNEAGMALSFLGREICRPSQPKCSMCIMKECCEFSAGI
jgi:endonuclease-3